MYYVFVLKTVSELDEDPRPYQLDHVRTGALGTKGRSTSERLKQTERSQTAKVHSILPTSKFFHLLVSQFPPLVSGM